MVWSAGGKIERGETTAPQAVHAEPGETMNFQASQETTLWLRARQSLGWALWRAARGDNPGILIGTMIFIVAIFAVMLRDTGFMAPSNLLAIVRLSTTITVMTVATVYVLCASEIDLSIASIIPVSALIAAVLLSWHYNFLVAAGAAVAFGALVGLANGLVTVFFGIPSFAVTLGSMGIMQGLAQIVTQTNTISISDDRFLFWFGLGSVGFVPILVLWSLAALAIGEVILSYTALGRRVLATGANASAARFSGIRTERIKVGVMIASGAAGALAGVLYDGQYAAGDFTLGSADLLSVIAAAIIGGASLSGGKGSVIGAVVASLLVGTLNNGLVLAGFGAPEQLMVQGIIIVGAVIVSSRNGRGTLWPWLAALEERRRHHLD
jgi:ribose transport system permease protein